jgi:hypothetical protein
MNGDAYSGYNSVDGKFVPYADPLTDTRIGALGNFVASGERGDVAAIQPVVAPPNRAWPSKFSIATTRVGLDLACLRGYAGTPLERALMLCFLWSQETVKNTIKLLKVVLSLRLS